MCLLLRCRVREVQLKVGGSDEACSWTSCLRPLLSTNAFCARLLSFSPTYSPAQSTAYRGLVTVPLTPG
jgi:hypothetical protein